MNKYFATFPAGTFTIIARQLKRFAMAELKIVEHDESSVVFQASVSVEKLIELRYFTNVYVIIEDSRAEGYGQFIKGDYYRLMYSKNGSPASLDEASRNTVQRTIEQNLNLKLNTHLSRNDFYVIERSSSKKLLALRLPRAKFKRESLSAGELRPELAHILCLAAGLKPKYMVLDMFAGYGSIPLEAVRGFGCRKVMAVDVNILKNRHEHQVIEWHTADARNLDFLANDSIDRVITDPPWGAYDSSVEDIEALYSDAGKEMARVLKPNGIAVVLSGFASAQQSLLAKASNLKIVKTWDILVSGKKATIYKLKKIR